MINAAEIGAFVAALFGALDEGGEEGVVVDSLESIAFLGRDLFMVRLILVAGAGGVSGRRRREEVAEGVLLFLGALLFRDPGKLLPREGDSSFVVERGDWTKRRELIVEREG